MLRFNKDQKYLSFDTETEGLNLVRHRPYQISYVLYTQKSVLEEYDGFIDLENFSISDGAAKVTKFDRARYDRLKRPVKEVYDKVWPLLSDPEIFVVGHNLLKFDTYMVSQLRKLVGEDVDNSWVRRIKDTKVLSLAMLNDIEYKRDEDFMNWQFKINNKRWKSKSNQKYMLEYFDIPFDPEKLHDSLYDVQKNRELFLKLLYKVEI